METASNFPKENNYQLLDSYQTNSPVFSSEEKIRSFISKEYADALFNFVLDLQKMFGLDPIFNHPKKFQQQRKLVNDLFDNCFPNIPASDRNLMFNNLIIDLIGGMNTDYNFAYGLKLYFLFKEDLNLGPLYKQLFKSRIERNLLSQYYSDNPQKYKIDNNQKANIYDQPLAKKLSKYKIFETKTSL